MFDWNPTVRFKLDEGAFPPERAHATDAGADLCTPVAFVLPCHGQFTVDTGVHVQLPPHSKAELVPKSGLNIKASIVDWGLIDEGYTGSIAVKLYNLGKQTHWFNVGDKIAQLVVSPTYYPNYVQSDVIEGGPRGDDGFGSSGR